MSDGKKETRPSSAQFTDIRARYREILKELAPNTRIPGIELVAETCHGGQFCHGGSTKNIEFDELIKQTVERT